MVRKRLQPIKPKINMIMDSGAFSAWRLNKVIDNIKYCDFLAENMDWIGHAVALDVIDLSNPIAAATQSFINWKYAKERGLVTVPVVHAGESFDWIDRYLDAGCTYLGLSASSMRGGEYVDNWYSMVWDKLAGAGGLPTVRTHCFGEGRFKSLARFPWASADSTSWIYSAQRNAKISVGRSFIAMRNDNLSQRGQLDLDRLDEFDRAEFDKVMARARIRPEALAGVDRAENREAIVIRTYLQALHYLEQQKLLNARTPITHQGNSLLSQFDPPNEKPTVDIPHMAFHLVLGGNDIAWCALAHAGGTEALVSYFYITQKNHFQRLRAYVADPVATCLASEPMATTIGYLHKNSY